MDAEVSGKPPELALMSHIVSSSLIWCCVSLAHVVCRTLVSPPLIPCIGALVSQTRHTIVFGFYLVSRALSSCLGSKYFTYRAVSTVLLILLYPLHGGLSRGRRDWGEMIL